jgi:hypothetical protein
VPAVFEPVFAQLRELLRAHAADFTVSHDTVTGYGLEAPVGPATLQAWGGKSKARTIPVASVKVGKAYVSYHLMGMPGNARLVASLSDALRARMQGTSCFNFKQVLDDDLLEELQRATVESLRGLKKGGYISDAPIG